MGGIHFKSGRGRGGIWDGITWQNIYGNHATALFGFSENHGSGYNQSLGPTNYSGTPVIQNLHIKDVFLTDVVGTSVIFTLAEAPILNFTLSNVTWSGKKEGYQCTGWRGTRSVGGLFATGFADNLTPPLPKSCAFLPPLPPPQCKPIKNTDLMCHDNGAIWCTDLGRVRANDAAACCRLCTANATAGGVCNAWTFNVAYKLCYLKNGHGREHGSTDISGHIWPNTRVPVPPVPPPPPPPSPVACVVTSNIG